MTTARVAAGARRAPATTTGGVPSPLLVLTLILLAAVAPRGASAVTASPDLPSISVPLDEATIDWMGQFVDAGTPAPEKYEWPFNSPGFIPWSDRRIRRTVSQCAPEQVHLGMWSAPEHVAESGGRLSVLVSYATCASFFGENGPPGPLSTDAAISEVWLRTGGRSGKGRYTKRVRGMAHSYENAWQPTEADPLVKYVSPIIHHVLLKGLVPGQRVDYAIPNWPQLAESDGGAAGRRRLHFLAHDAATNATSASVPAPALAAAAAQASKNSGGKKQFPSGTYYGSFTVPRNKFPFRIGAVGDAGQMQPNATVALQNLIAMKPDLMLSIGDNAYHDDTGTKTVVENGRIVTKEEFPNFMRPADLKYTDMVGFYSPRWESMHRLYSPLFSRVPVIQTPGNHELNAEPFLQTGSKFADVEKFVSRFKDYNAYWPSPQYPEQTRDGPTPETLRPVGPVPEQPLPETGMQNRNQYHSHVIPGIATVISLSNYILWENFGEEQLVWLRAQLAAVDRTKTPWLIAMWHSSWVSTFSKHWHETECMRRAYEPLFREFQVDVVFNGHNHGYERSKPMYNFQVDTSGCGTVAMMLGGGCADDLTYGYLDEERTMPYLPLKPSTCPKGKEGKVCPHTYCPDPEKFHIPGYQPPMLAKSKYEKAPACALPDAEHPAPLCPEPGGPPAYSAFRQATYGVGNLELLSPTRARWSWFANNRNKNGPKSATDSVILTRDPLLTCSTPPPP